MHLARAVMWLTANLACQHGALLLNVGSDILLIDKTLKNEWSWEWLSETGDNKNTFSLWCKKTQTARCVYVHV